VGLGIIFQVSRNYLRLQKVIDQTKEIFDDFDAQLKRIEYQTQFRGGNTGPGIAHHHLDMRCVVSTRPHDDDTFGAAGSVEDVAAVGGDDVAAFAAYCLRVVFAETSWKKCVAQAVAGHFFSALRMIIG